MSAEVGDTIDTPSIAPAADPGFLQRYGGAIEYILIPGAAIAAALAVFGVFVALFGKNPLDLYFYMYQGAFGTWFSWQNTLTKRRSADPDSTVHGPARATRHGHHRRRRRAADRRARRNIRSVGAALQSSPARAVQTAMVMRRHDRRRPLDHARGWPQAISAASMKPSRACCWSISRWRFSIIWSKA